MQINNNFLYHINILKNTLQKKPIKDVQLISDSDDLIFENTSTKEIIIPYYNCLIPFVLTDGSYNFFYSTVKKIYPNREIKFMIYFEGELSIVDKTDFFSMKYNLAKYKKEHSLKSKDEKVEEVNK